MNPKNLFSLLLGVAAGAVEVLKGYFESGITMDGSLEAMLVVVVMAAVARGLGVVVGKLPVG